MGVDIAPQTLGRSVAAHIDLLTPMARLIEEQTRAPGLLGTYATGIPILDPNVADGIRTGAHVALDQGPVGDLLLLSPKTTALNPTDGRDGEGPPRGLPWRA